VADKKRLPIRVLIADDEAEVRDAYRQILLEADTSGETAMFHNLRDRLFSKQAADAASRNSAPGETEFAPVFCDGAESAVAAVRAALAADDPFAVAFLDMRRPCLL
jgi:CheY-like chemotaxis protein